ncbi:molybdate ABC transporter substrate-binding protein [Ramlibacter pallidus]|uniref:Molybdate ABC transporter substrate-binding protein n=1 Tax=Ramlibacter pallidus TaxID=2780087 RepID=A0ABR9SAG7_9BURK|nr:molybdate ABC transporter substrate-binding protein [Ramlibacter pallidus]MBE7369962.1 molybdate ABC transporter substrate-binding protein [Ramlibacter pallidus]
MFRALAFCLAILAACTARAGEVQVAAAANLGPVMDRIAAAFARDTGHRAIVALGSTGKLHTQVRNGAPFEVLLSADAATPSRLVEEGLAVSGTQFTYALGRLVLWSAREGVVDPRGDVLRNGAVTKLAIANPRVAPYGAAAMETLQNLQLLARWEPHLVTGESIAQAHQFVASGNAGLGFVALSQVAENGLIARGSGWIVPARLHAPIQQDAVLLKAGAANPAATAFLVYLRGNAARAILRHGGYGI